MESLSDVRYTSVSIHDPAVILRTVIREYYSRWTESGSGLIDSLSSSASGRTDMRNLPLLHRARPPYQTTMSLRRSTSAQNGWPRSSSSLKYSLELTAASDPFAHPAQGTRIGTARYHGHVKHAGLLNFAGNSRSSRPKSWFLITMSLIFPVGLSYHWMMTISN